MDIKLDEISKHIGETGDFIKLNREKCNGCGLCALVCVVNLWIIRGGVAKLKEQYKSKCLECAACYSVCNIGAIDFSYPKGGTGVVYLKG
ncbi:MAG: 4Fe-4S dicluster domain-containing protein [Candidatus Helarchaeota archaeon]